MRVFQIFKNDLIPAECHFQEDIDCIVQQSDILRVEYGSFRAAKTSLTTWVWKKEIEQSQGLRLHTKERDGNKSINEMARAQLAPVMGEAPPEVRFDTIQKLILLRIACRYAQDRRRSKIAENR